MLHRTTCETVSLQRFFTESKLEKAGVIRWNKTNKTKSKQSSHFGQASLDLSCSTHPPVSAANQPAFDGFPSVHPSRWSLVAEADHRQYMSPNLPSPSLRNNLQRAWAQKHHKMTNIDKQCQIPHRYAHVSRTSRLKTAWKPKRTCRCAVDWTFEHRARLTAGKWISVNPFGCSKKISLAISQDSQQLPWAAQQGAPKLSPDSLCLTKQFPSPCPSCCSEAGKSLFQHQQHTSPKSLLDLNPTFWSSWTVTHLTTSLHFKIFKPRAHG